MNKILKITSSAVISAALLGTALVATAKNDPTSEIAALTQASVNMNQAAEIALKTVAGTVSSADFDRNDGAAVWDIEVVSSELEEYSIEIDAMTGKVLKQQLNDVRDGHDQDDDNDNDKDEHEADS